MKRRIRVCVFGASGMLGRSFVAAAGKTFDLSCPDRRLVDVTDPRAVEKAVAEFGPDFVVNCSGFTDVEGAEDHEEEASALNGHAVAVLAEAARRSGAGFLHISTDYVFDGGKSIPYTEDDPPAPLNAYGRSKWAGERAVARSGAAPWFVVRTSWLFGPGGRNFVRTMARLAAERKTLRVVADQIGCPTYTLDLARAMTAMVLAAKDSKRDLSGLYHFTNAGRCSWHGFAQEIVAGMRRWGYPVAAEEITAVTSDEFPQKALRPRFSVLDKARFVSIFSRRPLPWRAALSHYLKNHRGEIIGNEARV